MSDQTDREARYAEAALSSIRAYMGLSDADVVWNFSLVKAAGIQAPAVIALADQEQAELRAERDAAQEGLRAVEALADRMESWPVQTPKACARAIRDTLALASPVESDAP